jgi:hypothetical protein
VKKIDYYAVQHPWRMPKWLGATLGAIFGFILIVSGVAIVKLTRSPIVPVAAVAALPSTSAPAAAPATSPAAKPAAVAPAAAPAEVAEADTAPAPTGKHHGKHHAASSRHAASHAVASSKHLKASGVVLANAKHDNRKLKEKDALDKLLGL